MSGHLTREYKQEFQRSKEARQEIQMVYMSSRGDSGEGVETKEQAQ